jgi:hypothetical protein
MKKFLIIFGLILGLSTPSFAAMWWANAAGNWDTAAIWNSQQDGLGYNTTHPLPSTDTAHLNGKAINLNVDVTISSVQAAGATGQLTVVSSHSVTGNIAYGGTLTTGMFVVPTGTYLTVYGCVMSTSTGYGIVTAGLSGVTVSSAAGIALMNTSSGRSMSLAGTGWFVINGTSTQLGSGYCVLSAVSSSTSTMVGFTTNRDSSGAALRTSAGTVTIDGEMFTAATQLSPVVVLAGGTVIWTGNRTLSEGYDLYFSLASGTLNITSLVLSNYGRFHIAKYTGTLTIGSGGTLAQINLLSTVAQASILGGQYLIVNPFSTGGAGGSYTFAQ